MDPDALDAALMSEDDISLDATDPLLVTTAPELAVGSVSPVAASKSREEIGNAERITSPPTIQNAAL